MNRYELLFWATKLSVKEIARRSGYSPETIWRLCHPPPFFSDEQTVLKAIAPILEYNGHAPHLRTQECVECGGEISGNRRKFCSAGCAKLNWDKRYRRKHARRKA